MSEVVNVADHSPVLFLQEVAKRIQDGFYADDSVASAPMFSGINAIQLSRQEEPKQMNDLSKMQTVNLFAYNPSLFMLDYQDAVLQGFDLVPDSVQVHDLPLTLTMVKPKVTLDVKKVEDEPKAEEAKKQTPRKSKSKEV